MPRSSDSGENSIKEATSSLNSAWGQVLRSMLQDEEGLRLFPYKDTLGKTTIGWGRNIEDVGISQVEADFMLDNDLRDVIRTVELTYKNFESFTPNQKIALAAMCFQLGARGLSNFEKMNEAIAKKNWDLAAFEALNSQWAKQTPARARRVANLFKK